MNKEKHLLILVDSYYPNASMNGIIAHRIASYVQNKYRITLLTYQSPYDNARANFSEKVFNWSWYYEDYLSAKINKRKSKKIWRILYKSKKILSNIVRNSSSVGVDNIVVNKIVKKIQAIHQDNPIDTILSIAAPFEFQLANYYFSKKYPEINSIIYQVDFWSELIDVGLPSIFRKRRKKCRIEMEKKMASQGTYVMIPFVYEKEKVEDSIQSCQLPLLAPNQFVSNQKLNSQKSISIVYAGSLSKRERNPENFLRMLLKLSEEVDFKMSIYHRGDCSDLINTYSSQSSSILNYGTVSSEVAYQAIGSADVLIMFGTPEGKQIAGKTFDYISTGKKIIYVYQNDRDKNVVFLKRYPHSIAIPNDELLSTMGYRAIKNFIENSIEPLSYSEVKDIFSDSLPQNFCERYL
ncbi:hypothetical protein [Streptococcus sp. 2021WUSS124]|uniref:hypothetical protein n=1 Tax=unclassified Streptococcus TaxID=2608887 RepID=UPI003795C46B